MPLFTYPLAFFGLLAIPVLVVIYCLRQRFRRVPVSSLMLWLGSKEVRAGGRRLEHLQTPLLFFLELLAILFLVLAAAGPLVRKGSGYPPLIVILDDSFSMRAGGDDSARSRAARALEEELRAHPPASVRLILAGERPIVLGEGIHEVVEALDLLPRWRCQAPGSSLDESLTLAAELGGDDTRLLVLTDHVPPDGAVPAKGRLQWRAFGKPLPNYAFLNASRSPAERGEHCRLEVANLSPDAHTSTLVVRTLDPDRELHRASFTLAPGESRRIALDLPPDTPALRARLDPDGLDFDNEESLLPSRRRPVRVEVRVGDDGLRMPIDKALRAVPDTILTAKQPDLVITDRKGGPARGEDTWRMDILSEKEAVAYDGPFVVDRTHPLTEGLSLKGIVWGAGKSLQLPGTPIILAGNVPLLSDTRLSTRHELRMRLRPDLSTLQSDPLSPAWPVLFFNLIAWRSSLLPGLDRANVRLGEDVALYLPSEQESVEQTDPDGTVHPLPVEGRRLSIHAAQPGVFQLRAGEERYAFAANPLARDESDLRSCASGTWGDWLDEATLRRDYQGIAWVFLLLFLGTLTIHQVLVARAGKRASL